MVLQRLNIIVEWKRCYEQSLWNLNGKLSLYGFFSSKLSLLAGMFLSYDHFMLTCVSSVHGKFFCLVFSRSHESLWLLDLGNIICGFIWVVVPLVMAWLSWSRGVPWSSAVPCWWLSSGHQWGVWGPACWCLLCMSPGVGWLMVSFWWLYPWFMQWVWPWVYLSLIHPGSGMENLPQLQQVYQMPWTHHYWVWLVGKWTGCLVYWPVVCLVVGSRLSHCTWWGALAGGCKMHWMQLCRHY